MRESKAVFENEDAVRLLNYFIFYKQVISITEEKRELDPLDDLPSIQPIDKPEFNNGGLPKQELTIK